MKREMSFFTGLNCNTCICNGCQNVNCERFECQLCIQAAEEEGILKPILKCNKEDLPQSGLISRLKFEILYLLARIRGHLPEDHKGNLVYGRPDKEITWEMYRGGFIPHRIDGLVTYCRNKSAGSSERGMK